MTLDTQVSLQQTVSELERKAQIERVKDTLRFVKNQFSNPFYAYGELVQNSMDAGTDQIDIVFEFQRYEGKLLGRLVASVEDYGEGMTLKERHEDLLRLFYSKKEFDRTKRGIFGIGFVSTLALNPYLIQVESCKQDEETGNFDNWILEMGGIKSEQFTTTYREGHRKKGTKVTLVEENVTQADFEGHVKGAGETLRRCRYLPVPIYVNGTDITVPFDIDSPVKITVKERDLEAVIALTYTPQYSFLNNRLVIKEGPMDSVLTSQLNLPFDHVSILANSPNIKHNISRDNVIRDEEYERTIRALRGRVDRLVEELFRKLEEYARRPDILEMAIAKSQRTSRGLSSASIYRLTSFAAKGTEELDVETVYSMAASYLREAGVRYRRAGDEVGKLSIIKKLRRKRLGWVSALPPAVFEAKIFPTLSGEPISIKDLVARYHKKSKDDNKEVRIYLASEETRLTSSLIGSGRTILLDNGYMKGIRGLFGEDAEVNAAYRSSRFVPEGSLTVEEFDFLTSLRREAKKTPVKNYYSDILFSFSKIPFESIDDWLLSYISCLGNDDLTIKFARPSLLTNRRTLALGRNSDLIKRLVALSSSGNGSNGDRGDGMVEYLAMQMIARGASDSYFSIGRSMYERRKIMEHYLQRKNGS